VRGTLAITDDAPPTVDDTWRRAWPRLAELGVTGFCVPEEKGGFGFHVEAAVAVAREFGAALHGSPYAALTASAHALAQAVDPVADEVLAGVLSGDQLVTFGALDPVAGVAWAVDGAPDADALVLSARPQRGPLFWIRRMDGRCAARLRCQPIDRRCHRRRRRGAASPAARCLRLYGLLLAADAVGCVQRMLDRTVESPRNMAFGRPIGVQTVQHRLTDHTVRRGGARRRRRSACCAK
jgi:alkylation response protein AidB-like acyl-CoA dehydrogenase